MSAIIAPATPGVYFFSLDGANLLAVMVARSFYHMPYYWAEMRIEAKSEKEFAFFSRRRFVSKPVIFKARYRGLGPTRKLAESRSGTIEYFSDRALLPVYAQHCGRTCARECAPRTVAARGCGGRYRTQRFAGFDRHRHSGTGTRAALLTATRSLHVARLNLLCRHADANAFQRRPCPRLDSRCVEIQSGANSLLPSCHKFRPGLRPKPRSL